MKSLFTFFLIVTVFSVSAQDGVIVKYFDSSWKPTTKENASFYTQFVKDDTLYKCTSYYSKSNKLYGTSFYTDTLFSKGKARGEMKQYYESGRLKATFLYNNRGKLLKDYQFYENEKLRSSGDSISGMGWKYLSYFKNGIIKDSSFRTYKSDNYYRYQYFENGELCSKTKFDIDSNSLVKSDFDINGHLTSIKRLSTSVTIEAQFPGDSFAWSKYLQRNLDVTIPSRNGAPNGRYTVNLNFVVESDGSISDVSTENNPGYGTKEEAIRIMRISPKWKPAIQNGHTVKYLARQKITFVVN